MTFSICVREKTQSGDNRFGVAVTSQVPGVGLIPTVGSHGVVASQAYAVDDAGEQILSHVEDDLPLDCIAEGMLANDELREYRQIHGLDRTESFVHTGDQCEAWAGGWANGALTVAGNILSGRGVLEATETRFLEADPDRRLGDRLIEALTAGVDAGGDKRTMTFGSAALVVADPDAPIGDSFYNDLRTNATETPLSDLREAFERGIEGRQECAKQYDWD